MAAVHPRDGLSHVVGESAPALLDDTITAFFRRSVEQNPEQEAAVFCAANVRWNYGQLWRRVERFAAGLLAIGIYKGDRVGIWSPNRPEWLIAQLATARVGAVLVNVNPAYRSSELEYALNKVEAKALITALQFKQRRVVAPMRLA